MSYLNHPSDLRRYLVTYKVEQLVYTEMVESYSAYAACEDFTVQFGLQEIIRVELDGYARVPSALAL